MANPKSNAWNVRHAAKFLQRHPEFAAFLRGGDRRRTRPVPQIALGDWFWRHVNKTDSCWLWTGTHDSLGYGVYSPATGIAVLTHRLSFASTDGPLSASDKVLHRCDNPPCVNPSHLFKGTLQLNSRDSVMKGRGLFQKLTTSEVQTIRVLLHSMRPKDIAKLFNVTRSAIYGIRNGANWSWLPHDERTSIAALITGEQP